MFMSGMSVMLFDAPGSTSSILTILMFLSINSLPLFIFISILTSWGFYNKKNYKSAVMMAFLPLLSIILIAISLFLIEIINNGQFN